MSRPANRQDLTTAEFREAFVKAIGSEDLEVVLGSACRSMGRWSQEECMDALHDLWQMCNEREAQSSRPQDHQDPQVAELLAALSERSGRLFLLGWEDPQDDATLEEQRTQLESECDRLRARLRTLGWSEPAERAEPLGHDFARDFVQQLLTKAGPLPPTSAQIDEMRELLFEFDNRRHGIVLDVPLEWLPGLLVGWQLGEQTRWFFETPDVYLRQFAQKAPAALVLPLVAKLLENATGDRARFLLDHYASHALGTQPQYLAEWEQVLRGSSGDDEDDLLGLADQLAGMRRIRTADAAIATHLLSRSVTKSHLDAAERAVCRLRENAVLLDPKSLQGLLERDRNLLRPTVPAYIDGLIRGSAREVAIEFLRLETLGTVPNFTAASLLTLCIECQLKESLCRQLAHEDRQQVFSVGFRAIWTALAVRPIDKLRGLLPDHLPDERTLAQLERASSYRDKVHHDATKLPSVAGEDLRHMIFGENGRFLNAIGKLRLKRR